MLKSFETMHTATLFAAWDACRAYDLNNAKGEADKLGDQLTKKEIDRICNERMTDAEITDFYNAFLGV